MTIDDLFDAQYKDVSRKTARKFTRIPKCGNEIVVALRIKDGYKQTLWLQNISNAVFRFRVHTSVVPEVTR